MIFNILSLEMLAINSLVDLNNYLQLHVLNIRFIEFVHGTGCHIYSIVSRGS